MTGFCYNKLTIPSITIAIQQFQNSINLLCNLHGKCDLAAKFSRHNYTTLTLSGKVFPHSGNPFVNFFNFFFLDNISLVNTITKQ